MNSIALRLALTTRSAPPVLPVDANTGFTPGVWRGEDWQFQLAVFNPQGGIQDLSNLTMFQVNVFPAPIPPRDLGTNYSYAPYTQLPFPSSYPAPTLNATVLRAQFNNPILSVQDWEQGQAQVTANFSWIDTSSLNLGGKEYADFWLVLQGFTGTNKLTYGATPLRVFESGIQGIYLPNQIAPLVVPLYTTLLVQANQQLPYSQTIVVDGGQIELEGQLIQLT